VTLIVSWSDVESAKVPIVQVTVPPDSLTVVPPGTVPVDT
jgi:hypothetical protein